MPQEKINIALTKDEYLKILRSVDIFDFIDESLKEYDDKELNYEEQYKLQHYLLSFAHLFGLPKVDLKKLQHDWVDDFSEESFDILDEYAEMEMWEKLAHHLAKIVYERKYSFAKHSSLDSFAKIEEISEQILNEFTKNGLENVEIKGIIEKYISM